MTKTPNDHTVLVTRGTGFVGIHCIIQLLHLRAMVHPNASNQRFLALADEIMQLPDIARLLKTKPGDRGQKITTRVAPDWLVRLFAMFKPALKDIAGQLGRNKNASNVKAKKLLNWQPRNHEEAILAADNTKMKHAMIHSCTIDPQISEDQFIPEQEL